MKISIMPAGPDMDKLVAELVMGWTLGPPHLIHEYMMHGMIEVRTWLGSETPTGFKIEGWSPSTEIAAAWEVFEKLFDEGINVWIIGRYGTVGYECHHSEDMFEPGKGETPSLAICRAGLKYFCKKRGIAYEG